MSETEALTTVHVIGSKVLGGAERFFVRLVKALHDRGEHAIALVRRGGPVGPYVPPGIPVYEAPMRAVWDPLSRWQVTRTVRRLKPHIVQTYMGRATRLTHLSPRDGITHIARLGGFYKLDGYRHADAWIGNTRGICDYLCAHGFPRERVFYIPNFIEPVAAVPAERLAAVRTALGLPPDALVIAGVGRLIGKKGFADLVKAFARVPAAVGARPVHLVIVGTGELLAEVQALAAARGVAARTHFAGWQQDTDPYYALADVFVCPSLHEPLGNVILEAWGHGRAVVSTATHGARELISEGVDGMLVPCGAADELAAALRELLADDQARRQLGERGLKRVRADFSREAVVGRYVELYHRLRKT